MKQFQIITNILIICLLIPNDYATSPFGHLMRVLAQLRPQHYARFGATVVRSNKKKLIGAALGSGIMGGSLAWLIKDLLDSINEVIEDAEARKLLKQLFPVNFKFENSQYPARMEEFNNEWIFETAKNNWNKRDLAKICIIGL